MQGTKLGWFQNRKREKKEGEGLFLIVGLGNPGREYEGTHHNIGFAMVDALAEEAGIPLQTVRHRALVGRGSLEGRKVLLAKPQTYMNLSGECVGEMVRFYKVDPERDLLILYDDVSLDVGQFRIRTKGSPGGHNGIKNIIAHLGTQVFLRLKVGVGEKPQGWDLADYVLGHFGQEDRRVLAENTPRVLEAVHLLLRGEAEKAMNLYNRRQKGKAD